MKKLFAFLLVTAAAAPAYANIVVNGSFETGDFSGWTRTGLTSNSGVYTGNAGGGYVPTDGNSFAYFGQVGATGGISQTLTTTAGAAYTLSFDLGNPSGGTPSTYSVSVDGNVLDSLTNPGAFSYSTRVFSFTASSAATVLAFSFRQDPDDFVLDNVIVDAADVPEPAMLGLFGLGAIGLGLSRRRKA